MTGGEALRRAVPVLEKAGVDDAARDARKLLAWSLGVDGAALAARIKDGLTDDQSTTFSEAIRRRANREPVSHITGVREFWGRTFYVTPDVLDPRPETELLVELALAEPFSRVLDLGTGSGAILISLLADRAEARGVGTDISDKAVLVAGSNAARHGVADRIVLPIADWFDDVGGQFDLIVSNPPYIAPSEMPDLAPEVGTFEPRAALTDDVDGLSAYRAIATRINWCLAPGGRILVEIGPTQADAVSSIFAKAGLTAISVHRDLAGRDRVVAASR